jgi:hypothetical protein
MVALTATVKHVRKRRYCDIVAGPSELSADEQSPWKVAPMANLRIWHFGHIEQKWEARTVTADSRA